MSAYASPQVQPLIYNEDWPSIDSRVVKDLNTEAFIQDILAQMSLEEKVGQMIQPDLREVTPAEVSDYKLGTILNGGGAFPGNNKYATARDWAETADEYHQAGRRAFEGRAFHIPFAWATDAVHGHNNVFGATLFPHNIGLGADASVEAQFAAGMHKGSGKASFDAGGGQWWVDSFAGALDSVRAQRGAPAEPKAKKRKAKRDAAGKKMTFLDECFAATNGARLGMRARQSQGGKLRRTEKDAAAAAPAAATATKRKADDAEEAAAEETPEERKLRKKRRKEAKAAKKAAKAAAA